MKLLLDTKALVVFFKKETEYENIKSILESIEEKKISAFISTITLTDLFYIFSKYIDQDFARTVLSYIRSSNLTIVPLTEYIAEKSGELKFKYSGKDLKSGLPVADCIIAATAMTEDAVLLTNDEHFKKIRGLKIRWV